MIETIDEEAPPGNRREDDGHVYPLPAPEREVHPWYGEPPDLETARRWVSILSDDIQKIQTELGNARDGGIAYWDDGSPVAEADLLRWRREKLDKKDARHRRHRWVKDWVMAHEGIAALPTKVGKTLARDKHTPVELMFAATRRLELLEHLFEVSEALLADGLVADVVDQMNREGWTEFVRAVEIVQAHGTRPLSSGT